MCAEKILATDSHGRDDRQVLKAALSRHGWELSELTATVAVK